MRYVGQGHEIAVALPARALTAADAATYRAAFEAEYTRQYERHIPGAPIEIMRWIVLATTETEPPCRLAPPNPAPAPSPIGERSVFDARLGRRIAVPLYDRSTLSPGTTLAGPALIVEDGTSTYVSPTFDATVDSGLALVLTAKSPLPVALLQRERGEG
jgi:N-methylhydantoinase A